MLTSSLHSPSSAVHILFNMVALWFIGRAVEPAIGRCATAWLLLAPFGGSVTVLYLADPLTPTVGASGAVFGVFGARFVLLRCTGAQTGGLVALVVATLVTGLIPGLNISWQGHLGGLITGVGFRWCGFRCERSLWWQFQFDVLSEWHPVQNWGGPRRVAADFIELVTAHRPRENV